MKQQNTYKKILAEIRSISPAAASLNVSGIEEFNVLSNICRFIAEPINASVYRFNPAELVKPVHYNKNGIILDDFQNQESDDENPFLDCELFDDDYVKALCSHIKTLMLDKITGKTPVIWVLQDTHHTLGGEFYNPLHIRFFKTLLQQLGNGLHRIIFTGVDVNLASDFDGLVSHHTEILPTQEEIKETILNEIFEISQDSRFKVELDFKANETALIRKSQGLTLTEISNIIRYSTRLNNYVLDESLLTELNNYKIQKLQKIGVEFADSPETGIGGLKELKNWLERRQTVFNATLAGDVIAAKLPSPKGLFLVGVPGTGKSLAAKVIGEKFSIPVAKLEISSVFNSLVGESEKAIKNILDKVSNIAPCVLWIDEIEKLFGGNGGNDSGVSNRVFGTFLTWMQEKPSGVFVVATANSIDNLPPELLRKGRFDEIFFIDIPSDSERLEILEYHLKRYDVVIDNLTSCVEMSQGFVGAEIAAAIDESALIAFSEGTEINSTVVIKALGETTPISIINADKINAIRQWGHSKARIANTKTEPKTQAKTQAKKRSVKRSDNIL